MIFHHCVNLVVALASDEAVGVIACASGALGAGHPFLKQGGAAGTPSTASTVVDWSIRSEARTALCNTRAALSPIRTPDLAKRPVVTVLRCTTTLTNSTTVVLPAYLAATDLSL